VDLPNKETRNGALKSLWARAKVDDLMDKDLMGVQRRAPKKEIKEQIINVALAHRIVTQFTSFVAVEEAVVTVGGKPTKVTVPVEMPDGVSREGIFGADKETTVAGQFRPGRIRAKGGSWTSRVLPSMRKVYRGVPGGVFSYGKSAPQPEASARGYAGIPVPSPPTSRTTGSRPAKVATSEDAISKREERTKFAAIARKLSPDLYELVRKKDKPRNYSKGKVTVKDGKLTVQVWLTRISDDILKKLKEKGLKISFKASTGKLVIGEVELEKLEELSKVKEIRLIEPFVKA
jgi:Ca-activated chloride channel family protein